MTPARGGGVERSRRTARGGATLHVIFLACGGCGAEERPDWIAHTPEGNAIERWLDCTECSDGELGAVEARGSAAVPPLARVLHDGPDPQSLAAHRRDLGDDYDRLAARASSMGMSMPRSRSEYVDHHASRLDTRHRLRAVVALEAIGGPEAENALRGVSTSTLPRVVADALRAALADWPNRPTR